MPTMLLDAPLCLAALALALALKPWRSLDAAGPPWPWLAWCAVLPFYRPGKTGQSLTLTDSTRNCRALSESTSTLPSGGNSSSLTAPNR